MDALLEICPLAEEHLDDVFAVESLCFPDPWSRATFRYTITNLRDYYVVALLQGTLVGYAGVQMVVDFANLDNIAIHPSVRGQGVGRQLLEHLLTHCREEKINEVLLEVRGSNAPAIRLYERFGFVEVGRRKDYYKHPTEDAILMTMEL